MTEWKICQDLRRCYNNIDRLPIKFRNPQKGETKYIQPNHVLWFHGRYATMYGEDRLRTLTHRKLNRQLIRKKSISLNRRLQDEKRNGAEIPAGTERLFFRYNKHLRDYPPRHTNKADKNHSLKVERIYCYTGKRCGKHWRTNAPKYGAKNDTRTVELLRWRTVSDRCNQLLLVPSTGKTKIQVRQRANFDQKAKIKKFLTR